MGAGFDSKGNHFLLKLADDLSFLSQSLLICKMKIVLSSS